jgi:secondary thiamine-phosphate synthase enzyme
MESLAVRSTQHAEYIDVTHEVRSFVNAKGIRNGLLFAYIPHTTAGITINECADPTVVHDILADLQRLFPERQPYYRHMEGNSASHMKASMMGSSVIVAVEDGALLLGTWQGIFLREFDGPRNRKIHLKFLPDQGISLSGQDS